MPAKSQQQLKYIWAMRRKYKSKKKAPKNMKWIFDKEWVDVKFRDLPKTANENISNFSDWVAVYFNT